MAAENCLWGAPRIHGDLLKFGIAISERTVSRYLRGRPTTRSQTWRTFFANHLGQTAISPVMFAEADHEEIAIDGADVSFHPVPIDASRASQRGRSVDWRRSLQPSLFDVRPSEDHLQRHAGPHKSSGRDPPQCLLFQLAVSVPALFGASRPPLGSTAV